MKPIPLRIKLPYGSEAEFVERYGSNVARGGIFVATRSLKPEGAVIGFEFVLAGGERLLRGEAVVVKAQIDEGGQRAGMTLRFTRLDAASKALIDRVVEQRGGEPAPEEAARSSEPPAAAPDAGGPPPPGQQKSAPRGGTASAATEGAFPPGLVSRARPAPAPAAATPATPVEAAAPATKSPRASATMGVAAPDDATPPVASVGAASPATKSPRASATMTPAAPDDAMPPAASVGAASPATKSPRASATMAPAAPDDATPQVASVGAALPATKSPRASATTAPAAPADATPQVASAEAAPPRTATTLLTAHDERHQAHGSRSTPLASDGPAPQAALPAHLPTAPLGAAATTASTARPADAHDATPRPASIDEASPVEADGASSPEGGVEHAAPSLEAEAPPEPPEPELPPARAPRADRQPVLIRAEDIAPAPPAPKRRRSVPDLEIPKPAADDRAPDVVLGIDLGTTNSRVAVFKDGRPQLVPLDREGKSFALPSLVALDHEAGALVVGERARDAMVRDPGSAVFAAKRLIGQRARSPNVTARAERLPFRVVPDRSGDAAIRFGDNVYSMAELSSVLIKELKDAAARHLGHAVSRAVLCVPAYFNDHQRTAMLEAAKLAGLEVLRIFNEPTSVSLAFGYGQALPRKRILVYDLGGGTFGASVVEVTGDELEVVATGGDNFLGGMDFDDRVATELSGRFEQKEQRRLDATPIGQQRLRDAAERAKIALSDQAAAAVHLPGAAIGSDGAAVDLRDELSRDRLEGLTAELVERTIEVTRAVLASAGLTAEKLDEVLLVGGQSRAPLVRRRVQELCGRPPRTDVDAQAAVALGAAILGHALTEGARGKPGVTLSEVLSAPVGIGERGGGIQRVFERNTRLPAEKTVSFPVSEGQSVGIAVFQGVGARAEENEYLGCIETRADRGGEVTLHFALSADGTLGLTAISPTGRREVARMTTADAPDDARAAMLAASPLGATGEPRPGLLKKGLAKLLRR